MDKHLLAGGFGFPLGFLAAITVALGSAAVGAFAHPVAVLVALTVVTFAVSLATTLPAALGTAFVSWGTYTGFVLDSLGELQLNGRSALAAVVLVLAALVAVAAVALRRWWHTPRGASVSVIRFAPPVRG
ncbi:hypothetical protein [Kutzneria sp. NPDC052558]|uniref:hypothetical protein n=1 Tax=Kutzneria sp. NPDC052558 TaxID=3364121 RepID=UPI0037C658F6